MRGTGERPAWVRWAVTGGIAVAGFLALMIFRGGFTADEPGERWKLISDALFVPGVLLLGVGILIWISHEGEFDMLSFGVRKAFGIFRSQEVRDREPRTFYDYKESRKGREPGPISHLLIIGLIFVLLGAAGLIFEARYAVPADSLPAETAAGEASPPSAAGVDSE